MADPTLIPGTLQEIWDDMLSFTETLQDREQKARFANYRRYFILLVMESALAAVPDAIVFMQQNRKFLKNGTASDITITGDGEEWVFPVGSVYACSPEELDFFLGKCVELGITGLTQDIYTTWTAFGFPSYFWS